MALNFNGNIPKKIIYNTKNVSKLIYNGIVVWTSKILAKITGIPPLVLKKSTGEPLVNYKIYGNSIQEGEPTPENPIEVQSLGDKTENLYEFPYSAMRNISGSGNNRTVTNSTRQQSSIIQLKPNTTYTLSGDRRNSGDNFGRIALFDTYPNIGAISTRFLSYNSNNMQYITFTTLSSEIYAVVLASSDFEENYNMMLTEGTSREYVPYGYKIPIKINKMVDVNEGEFYDAYISANNVWQPSSDSSSKRYEVEVGKKYKLKLLETEASIVSGIFRFGTTNSETIAAGTSGVKLNQVVRTTPQETQEYEIIPTGKYLIVQCGKALSDGFMNNFQIICEDDYITSNIYLNEPLRKVNNNADEINFEGNNLFTIDTEFQPSNVEIEYYKEGE